MLLASVFLSSWKRRLFLGEFFLTLTYVQWLCVVVVPAGWVTPRFSGNRKVEPWRLGRCDQITMLVRQAGVGRCVGRRLTQSVRAVAVGYARGTRKYASSTRSTAFSTVAGEATPYFADFEVPERLIAQVPVDPPDMSRLMVIRREEGIIEHKFVSSLVLTVCPFVQIRTRVSRPFHNGSCSGLLHA